MKGKRSSLQKDRAARLLAWYDVHRRVLPWRAQPGESPDPYRIWLSEIMLQQTTVAAVADYFVKFVRRWPTVADLAAAPLDEVLAAWAGLGYYARARNLHKAAQIIAKARRFPDSCEGLRALPGVGEYTAGAIAAIAFDIPAAAVDANAERVLARLFGVEEPLPSAKRQLRAHARNIVPRSRAGDFAQALMDLGATVCTPKSPQCVKCPWTDDCVARKQGTAETLPRKNVRRGRPLKRGAAFVVRDAHDAVLLVRRPERGLLGGMLEPPLGPWTYEFPSRAEALLQAPFRADWRKRPGTVRHGFTHFEIEIEVWTAEVAKRPAAGRRGNSASAEKGGANADPPGARWIPIAALDKAALPTVMRKIVEHGLDEGGPLFSQARSARKR